LLLLGLAIGALAAGPDGRAALAAPEQGGRVRARAAGASVAANAGGELDLADLRGALEPRLRLLERERSQGAVLGLAESALEQVKAAYSDGASQTEQAAWDRAASEALGILRGDTRL
jgi:hypothetical protein